MNGTHDYQRSNDHARKMTEIALRGTALLWDLQADTARSLLEMQANGATLFGAPDLTQVFHMGNGRSKGMFSMTVEQALNSLRQINDTVTEVQWQLTRVAEQQTVGIADRIQQSIEELGRRSQEGLQEIRRLAEEEVGEFRQAAHEATSNGASGHGQRRSRSARRGRGNSRSQQDEGSSQQMAAGANAGEESQADARSTRNAGRRQRKGRQRRAQRRAAA